jgi:transcriptional regulator with XRE-family HTH domain
MTPHEIGEHIQAERRKYGMSLYRLSRLSGVSIRHLHMIEDGKHDVRVSTLQKILKAFNQKLKFTDT